MNDSFILSRNIDDIMNKIQEKIINRVKFVGLSRSDILKLHYQSYFWVLNYNFIPIFCLAKIQGLVDSFYSKKENI